MATKKPQADESQDAPEQGTEQENPQVEEVPPRRESDVPKPDAPKDGFASGFEADE